MGAAEELTHYAKNADEVFLREALRQLLKPVCSKYYRLLSIIKPLIPRRNFETQKKSQKFYR